MPYESRLPQCKPYVNHMCAKGATASGPNSGRVSISENGGVIKHWQQRIVSNSKIFRRKPARVGTAIAETKFRARSYRPYL